MAALRRQCSPKPPPPGAKPHGQVRYNDRVIFKKTNPPPLLAHDEPKPWCVGKPEGQSPYLILCDHAGNRIPQSLGSLGLPDCTLQRHIAWDIGAGAVAQLLAEALDATVILQPYSRLVIDCNRPPGACDSIVRSSEDTAIPGNLGLTPGDIQAREQAVFWPYHRVIESTLDTRRHRGQATFLIALHSFTPVFLGAPRPWHTAVLSNRDRRMANLLAAALKREDGLLVGDNEPYALGDDTDYSIPHHGEARGLLHVELEIRQDQLATGQGQALWAARLARILLVLQHELTALEAAHSAR